MTANMIVDYKDGFVSEFLIIILIALVSCSTVYLKAFAIIIAALLC